MGGTDLTILVALAAGVVSFLSPCVLPLVPAYLGQLTAVAVASNASGAPPTRWTALRHGLAYVLGFGAVFTLLGVTATYAASGFAQYMDQLRWIGGLILVILGISLTGLVRIPILERTWRPLDAGAAESVATATGSVAFATPGGGRVRAAARWAARDLARRLARVVRARRHLRDRLDALHRDHPRRDPDAGRDVDDRRAGRDPAGRLHGRPRVAVPGDRVGLRSRAGDPPAARAPRPRACRSSAGCWWSRSASR